MWRKSVLKAFKYSQWVSFFLWIKGNIAEMLLVSKFFRNHSYYHNAPDSIIKDPSIEKPWVPGQELLISVSTRYLGFHKIETVWVGGLKDFECETLGWEWSVWLTAGFTSNLRDFLRICLGTSQWQMVSDRSCLCIGLQPQKISSFLAQT